MPAATNGPLRTRRRLAAAAVRLSVAAVAVMLGSTFYGAGIAAGGKTEQGVAFVVTFGSIVVAIASGSVAAVLAGAGRRGRGIRWALCSLFLGLVCALIEIMDAIHNM
jgi:hypothetical protein